MKTHAFIFFLLLNLISLTATAAPLGKITVMDPLKTQREIIYEMIDNDAVVEGDILIGRVATLNQLLHASILPELGGNRWPEKTIPFELDEELPLANKLSVLQAITLWQEKTHLKFIELTSKNRSLYPDYLSFVPASGTICASFVGKQSGKQLVKLSPRCTMMNTVHEIGHALGLWHEQSRVDRDSYVRIAWENIQEGHEYNFNQHIHDGQDYGEYDYDSIMHYSAYAFSKNGEKTIVPLIDGREIGQRDHLSERDIAAVNAMYP